MNPEDPIDKLLRRAALDLPVAAPPAHFAEQVIRLHQATHSEGTRSRRLGLNFRWLTLGLGLGLGSAYAALHGEAEPILSSEAPARESAVQQRARQLRPGPSPWSQPALAEKERSTSALAPTRASERKQTTEHKSAEMEPKNHERTRVVPRCECGPAAVVCSCY